MATHFKQKLSLIIVGAFLLTSGLALHIGHVSAAEDKDAAKATDISSGVTQSYSAGQEVQTGMLVMRNPKDENNVIPLSQKEVKQLLGVVVPNGNAAIVITPAAPDQTQVLVAPNGKLVTLVSNQNGVIKKGDYLAISSLDGIAMKADASQSTAIGRAETNFDGKTDIINTTKTKNSLGQEVTIAVGRIPVEVAVTHNPSFKQASNDYVPAFIGKIVFQVTSKNVSAARVYIAIVLLIGIIILAGNILFGGVRGGMVAIGRNPLSKKSIIFSLVQTVAVATAIFVGGVAGIFFFLKL